jgi:hypothetical protein
MPVRISTVISAIPVYNDFIHILNNNEAVLKWATNHFLSKVLFIIILPSFIWTEHLFIYLFTLYLTMLLVVRLHSVEW